MNELILNFSLNANALGHLTAAVQFGFILGTLMFAILTIADRFSPSKVFLTCAVLGALCNLGILWEGNNLASMMSLRFITGFFLAGIYPVGMKIAADYYEKGLGKSLGFLVGALVIGTAFPHLAKGITGALQWQFTIVLTSLLALIGGLFMLIMVPDGPYRQSQHRLDLSAFFGVFGNRKFRAAAFGYFGHMWELYAFWTFVPVILTTYSLKHPEVTFNIPLWSFIIIGIGGLACVLAGYLAQTKGTKQTARMALALSCGCCLVSPFIFLTASAGLFIGFLMFWGMVVIADSPLFSTLVAQNASAEVKGTALTIVNCIGFSITIISIQLLNVLEGLMNPTYIYTLLAFGPLLGLMALFDQRAKARRAT